MTSPSATLPFWQMYCVVCIQIAEAININVLFPFMAFMVDDFGHGGPELGYYTGGLAAAFCGAQFCSAIFWGMMSDRYGRKPVLIVGTFGAGIGMLVFGFAREYVQAILGRILGGLLSGNVGVIKSFLNEVTTEKNRGAGFAYLSLSWSVGTILAPLAGGMLSRPAKKYELFKGNIFFETYPYALPCMFCSIFTIFAALSVWCFMVETRIPRNSNSKNSLRALFDDSSNVRKEHHQKYSQVLDSSNHHEAVDVDASLEIDDNDENDDMNGIDGDVELASTFKKNFKNSNSKNSDIIYNPIPASSSEVGKGSDSGDTKHSSAIMGEEGLVYCSTCNVQIQSGSECTICMHNMSLETIDFEESFNRGHSTELNDMDDDEESDDEYHDVHAFSCLPCVSSPSSSSSSKVSLFWRRRVVISTCNYGMIAMAYILIDETLPLFLKLDDEEGGFSFDSSKIGMLMSVAGIFLLLYSLVFLPRLAGMSKARLFLISSIGAIPALFLWPLIAMINHRILSHWGSNGYTIMWSLLIATAVIRGCFAQMHFTAIMIQVNDSVADKNLGAINGLGQSIGALARAVGPALGGILWSISVSHDVIFLNFVGGSVLLIICQLLNSQLPDPKPRLRSASDVSTTASVGYDQQFDSENSRLPDLKSRSRSNSNASITSNTGGVGYEQQFDSIIFSSSERNSDNDTIRDNSNEETAIVFDKHDINAGRKIISAR